MPAAKRLLRIAAVLALSACALLPSASLAAVCDVEATLTQVSPPALKLLSPWKTNALAGPELTEFKPSQQVTREQYADYLERYREAHALDVSLETAVDGLEKQADGSWLVRTSKGVFAAPVVVNATGYFGNAFVPELEGRRTTRIPQLHFNRYRGPETVRATLGKNTGRVLVVGKRLSAGQVMRELADAGFDVALSFRGKLEFAPVGPEPGALGRAVLFRVGPKLEGLALALGLKLPRPTMEGGRTKELVRSGQVKTFANVARFEADAVVFEDGRRERFDLVVYATGFRPVLSHLEGLVRLDEKSGAPVLVDGGQSADAPGLYFLGLDGQSTDASRFLRGLREDAARLAARLAPATK
ncbi:MAG: NAD(P)-binding domain-containing protein [Deltaproteobacteria bacterium]|nr:NAD(P)-binding domain-containing protein [Deltaproteobacteria bacterium]